MTAADPDLRQMPRILQSPQPTDSIVQLCRVPVSMRLPIAVFVLACLAATGHDHASAQARVAARTASVADVVVRSQDDQALHFYRDLVQGASSR